MGSNASDNSIVTVSFSFQITVVSCDKLRKSNFPDVGFSLIITVVYIV